jgi:hypothetical protein
MDPPPWAQLFGLHRHIDPNLEATTEIENAIKHHEKSLEIPKCVDDK